MTTKGAGFLTFNSLPPRLHITADTDDFDSTFIAHLKGEGFDVTYLPWHTGGKAYRNELAHLADDLELGENYAIIAFGNAATDCLEFHIKPQPHLAALICYYPTQIHKPNAPYPTQLQVLCHVAGNQNFAPSFRSYTYRHAKVGFAENDLGQFDKSASELAWTRTLGLLKKAFKLDVDLDLEDVRERHSAAAFVARDPKAMVENMAPDAYANHVSTMTGSFGQEDLLDFYRDYFTSRNPPSLTFRLVSRTMGVDRVVDEMVLSFKHTHEMPWMLPGVKPTSKVVHIPAVSIVCVRGGKLYHEHLYWDQASVLVQVGLLRLEMVPEAFRKQGLKRLPVCGSAAAAKVLDEESEPYNELIGNSGAGQAPSSGSLPSRPKQAAQKGQANGSA